jgi:hypothetical protein
MKEKQATNSWKYLPPFFLCHILFTTASIWVAQNGIKNNLARGRGGGMYGGYDVCSGCGGYGG